MRLLILFTVVLVSVFAQTTGDIEGFVTDPSGAVVNGAAVRLTDTETGAGRRFVTGPDGSYIAPRLPPGAYEIIVDSKGFRQHTRRGIHLDAGRSLRIDFRLEIGEQAQSVVVEAAAPLVSPSATDWGSSVSEQRLENLPLNGRDVFELALRETGASISYTTQRNNSNGLAMHMSVNGARPWQNAYRVDGLYANDASGSAPASASGQSLGIEALQELRLVSSPFLAEYGRAAGGMFTAVSKSGSNSLHGSLFEFVRNSALDARNFFDPPGAPIPPLKRNQFGGMLSGPIVRNRLFFLVNYEGVRSVRALTSISTTLGAAAREGNLPTGRVTVAPSVVPFLSLYPLPNGQQFSDGTGQFIAELATRANENYVTGKADYLVSERLRLNTRYTFDKGSSTTPDPFLLWDMPSLSRYHFATFGAQFTESPSTLHDLHVGFSRVDNHYTVEQTSLIPSGLTLAAGQTLGAIVVTGLTEIGQLERSLPFRYLTDDYQINWDMTRVRGRHTLKAGAGFDRILFNEDFTQDTRGIYQFTSIANLLAARPSIGQILDPATTTIRNWRQSLFYAYVQDEFRISRRLQLSAGVRYEPYTTPTEADGLLAALPDPLHDAAVNTKIGLFRNPSKANFAPRAALAWDLFGNSRTVFRAGSGIFYDPISCRDVSFGGARMPPFYNRLTASNPPFPGLLTSATAAGGVVVDGMQYDANQPYTIQMQAAVEHQLGQSFLVRVGFAGNRGVNLPGFVGNLNVPRPTTLADGQIFFSPTAPLLNPNFARIGLRLTQFRSSSNALQLHVSQRFARGFRFQVNYAFAKVIDQTSIVNFRDVINGDLMPFPLNFRINRGLASFDLRHVFAADWSWRTRRLTGWEIHGVFQAQSGPPFNPYIGFDRAGLRSNLTPELGQRPIYVPGVPVILGDPSRWFNPAAFALPAAGYYGNLGRNTLPSPGLVDTHLAVHKTVWSRERTQANLRVEVFNVANHPNFQIPANLNLFTSTGSRVASAGQITQTTTGSRQMQLALRIAF